MKANALTASQRARVERAVRKDQRRSADDTRTELNVVPFLDIVMNVLMFALATMATVFTAEVRPASAAVGPHGHGAETLTVHVVPGGYVVGSSAGFAAPGCLTLQVGGGITVPLRDGRHDAAALTRCLATLKTHTLASSLVHQDRIQVSSAGSIPYDELMRALDAARETSPHAGDLFPQAELGLVR